jgi:hypothetical protein
MQTVGMDNTKPTTTVEVDGLHVDIYVKRDADGRAFISLEGADCALEGEMPGEYYVTPLSTVQA